MRVLMLSQTAPHLPTHDRARLVPAYLLAHTAERHDVLLVTREARAETPAQQGWASSLVTATVRVPVKRWRHPFTGAVGDGPAAFRAAAMEAIERWRPHVAHLEGSALAPLAGALPVPVVVGYRESGVRRAREARRLAGSARDWMRAQLDERMEADWERRWLPAAHACVVASEDDRQVLGERVPLDRVVVIPPGVDETRYELRRSPEPARLVFAGHLARPAHLHAARQLAGGVLPLVRRALPRAELLVIGGGPRPALRALAQVPGVRVAGLTTDMRPSLWSAAVALVPGEAAPGVDAALLEAMALGTPIVAAARSLTGLGHVLPGHHVLVAENDEQMAEAALLVLREPAVAAALAAGARRLVERHYTWSAIARSYTALWARAVDAAPAVATA
jgi:polysaccharide biosynthesis protein PslH